ncbi:MAG: thrombospondin type 3 repeat-containing protein, partial [candidate division Zixibacteria bacterium]
MMSYTFTATDPEDDSYWFELVSGPGSIDPNTGVWTWQPSLADVGASLAIEVRACDADSCGITTSTDLNVTNAAPFFTSGCEDTLTAVAMNPLNFQMTANPGDCDPINWSIVNFFPEPEGPYSITSGGGLFSFTPTSNDGGYFIVTARVEDGALEGEECDFYINVYADQDSDGHLDRDDNCPTIANAGQEDADSDGIGDLCDNCPSDANAGQADIDDDGLGDVCDLTCDYRIDLLMPADDDSIFGLTSFEWQGFCDEGHYEVVLATDAALTSIIWAKEQSYTTARYSGGQLDHNSEYFWSVRGQTQSGWESFEPASRLYLVAPADTLPAPILRSPANSSTNRIPAWFSWTRVSGAVDYYFEFSPQSDFSVIVHSGRTRNRTTELPDLDVFVDLATYYWRVQAVDANQVAGPFSTYFRFFVDGSIPPPPPPTAYYPPVTDTVKFSTMTLAWSPSATASHYILSYSTKTSYSGEIVRTVMDTTRTIQTPVGGGRIYWRVKAVNASGESGWASGWDAPTWGSTIYCTKNCLNEGCITNIRMDEPDTFYVDHYANYDVRAIVGGVCDDSWTGTWHIGAATSFFALPGLPEDGLRVSSPILQATDTGYTDIYVETNSNGTIVHSDTVTMYVAPDPNYVAHHLSIWPSSVALVNDGIAKCTLSVAVYNEFNKKIYYDNGRRIKLRLSGTGTLQPGQGYT